MKRFIAFLLAMMLALLGLASCVEEPVDGSTAQPGESSSEYEESSEQKKEEIPVEKDGFRFIFVSDLHYTVKSFGNAQCNNAYGMAADERAQFFVDTMLNEQKKHPTKELFVFLLGDLTSSEFNYQLFDPEHAGYKNIPEYDLDGNGRVDLNDYYGSEYDAISELKTKYLDQLTEKGVQVYCVPGNHDTYRNDAWSELFGYANDGYVSGYSRSDAEYTVEVDETTAVVMLNSYNESRGSMTNNRDDSGKTYIGGTQQTLAYTESDIVSLRKRMEQLKRNGVQNVYLATHYMLSTDTAVKTVAEEYGDIVKGIFFGDEHSDKVREYFGVPTYVDGHFSVGLMRNPETGVDMDHTRLPVSYISVAAENGVATVDYHKVERLYLGADNLAYLSQYFTLTKDDALTSADDKAGENIVGLTAFQASADGTKDLSTLSYYRYVIREDLSDEDRLLAEKMKHDLDTYNVGVRLVYEGSTSHVYNYSYINYSFKTLDKSFFQAEEVYQSFTHPFVTDTEE